MAPDYLVYEGMLPESPGKRGAWHPIDGGSIGVLQLSLGFICESKAAIDSHYVP